MKKIAILTLIHSNNYGAVLQAYALKYALFKMGANAQLINYLPARAKSITLKNILKHTIFYPWVLYVNYKFSCFFHFLSDMPVYKKKNLTKLNPLFDCFIVGSDQVWNIQGRNYDTSYLLDFVKDNNKKFSYAASVGKTTLTQRETNLMVSFLSFFKQISVRENSVVQLINRISKKEVKCHIDPTLLLQEAEWGKIAQVPNKKNYILLYLMNRNPSILSFAKKLANKKNLQLILLSTSPAGYKNVRNVCPTPQQWLGYFFHAKYVITNSFHGLAFSINLKKDFFVGFLPPPSEVNSRLENLLQITGLQNRLYTCFTDNYDEPIDWKTVQKKLNIERQKAFDYLKEIIR